MSLEASRQEQQEGTANGNGNVVPMRASPLRGPQKLKKNPEADHQPENYEDLQLEFSPLLYSSLERYLPPGLLNASRNVKIQHMRQILHRYSPAGERLRAQSYRSYRQKIMSSYKPRHQELYRMHAADFFVPSFLRVVNENTEERFRSVISEPFPGIYTFEMLQPRVCELFLSEVENFERWIVETKNPIMRPNTMNKYGAVLDDFGMESMLGKLMNDFILPISRVFFPEVGGSTLDSHHGFVVVYGADRDVELGFHVDDSEVTLNVCLGKEFTGGELFFQGVRCDKHIGSDSESEEAFSYSHVPGHAILHQGRHRHGARAITSGNRVNLIMWCRSAVFREMKKYQKDFSSWCGECHREKKQKHHVLMTTTQLELLKRDGKFCR